MQRQVATQRQAIVLSKAVPCPPKPEQCKAAGCSRPPCYRGRCTRCEWVLVRKMLKARFPLEPGFPRQSWISMRAGSPGIGCKACAWFAKLPVQAQPADAGTSEVLPLRHDDAPASRYAQFTVQVPSLSNLKRHAQSRHHKKALSGYKKHLLDKAASQTQSDTLAGTPSEDEFLAMWKALGSSSTGSAAKVASHSQRKITTMEWCLWEALRDSERSALARASTIALAVDERKGRLLVSFSACSRKGLDVTTGFLAQLQHQGANSVDVAACVRKAVRRLCTRRRPHAGINRLRVKPTVAIRAERLILKRIELFTADGATNEQLALRLLHPKSARTSKVDKLPGLKLVLRDKAAAHRADVPG